MAVRWVTAHVVVGDPTFEWCERCHSTDLAAFPLVALSAEGVSPFGTVRRCLRCDPVEG